MDVTETIEQKYICQIQSAMKEIRRICLNQRIPMFISVYLPDKKKYLSDVVSPAVLGINIEPDRITEHINVANGFHTVLPIELMHGGTKDRVSAAAVDFSDLFDISELPED